MWRDKANLVKELVPRLISTLPVVEYDMADVVEKVGARAQGGVDTGCPRCTRVERDGAVEMGACHGIPRPTRQRERGQVRLPEVRDSEDGVEYVVVAILCGRCLSRTSFLWRFMKEKLDVKTHVKSA